MASEHPDGSSEHTCSTGSGQQLVCYCPDPRSRDSDQWKRWGSGSRLQEPDVSAKMGISGEARWGPVTRNFMLQLNSALFLQFLTVLSGADPHSPLGDPSFRGGGLHSTGSGGRLLVHSDTERHPLGTPFCQKLNIIVYLNRDWPDDYGGHLELWSRDASQCVTRIAPLFNRTVIFESGTNTYHGQPASAHLSARSISLFSCGILLLPRPASGRKLYAISNKGRMDSRGSF